MNGRRVYSKEELTEIIHKYVKEEGVVPKQRDFLNNRDYPSFKQFTKVWGSWSSMLIDLGYRDTKYPINKNLHTCKNCGKEFEAYGKRAYCSPECNYTHRRTYTKGANTQSYRKTAFIHYSWNCSICGYKEDIEYTKGTNKHLKYPVILDVHHIDGDRENNDVSNLVILCPTCHAKIHRGIITDIHRDKLLAKLKYSKAEVFGGKQLHPYKEVNY